MGVYAYGHQMEDQDRPRPVHRHRPNKIVNNQCRASEPRTFDGHVNFKTATQRNVAYTTV